MTAPSPAEDEAYLLVAWALADSQTGTPEAADLLRAVVASACAVDAEEVTVARMCPQCGSSVHGRPLVTVAGRRGPHVSLSRADGLVCVAVTDAGPVGVDCERVGAAEFTDFASVGLHRLEELHRLDQQSVGQDQTITWVRKESLVKATGDGLTIDLRQVRLADPGVRPRLLGWDGPRPPAGPVWMHDVVGPSGYALAVTVLSGVDPELTVLGADQLAADHLAAAPSATAHRAAGQATAVPPTRR